MGLLNKLVPTEGYLEKTRNRFKGKIKIDPKTGCHNWTAYRNKQGYGISGFNGKVEGAHRISYRIYKGHIPEGLHVLHSCDNPSCINPDHLRVGTNQDNMDDKMDRDRCYNTNKEVCPKCGGEFSFKSDGRRNCVPCRKKLSAAWYRRNRPRMLEKSKAAYIKKKSKKEQV